MKKHDEGYVLAFVMVVVAVLSLISLAVSTMAVWNVEVQQKAVERMQEKYEAEGNIEKIIAELGSLTVTETDSKTSDTEAVNAFNTKLKTLCEKYNSDAGRLPQDLVTVLNETELQCTFSIESAHGSTTVKTKIILKAEVKQENGKYVVGNPSLTYDSYETDSTAETTAPTTNPSDGGATE